MIGSIYANEINGLEKCDIVPGRSFAAFRANPDASGVADVRATAEKNR